MAVLKENDKRWIEIELGARALAKKLDLTYVSFPLGSKKPWQEPKPSSPTEKHLYMLLPHAIGIYPPMQSLQVVVVATMSPTAFFESMLEKFGCEVTKHPSDDATIMLLDLTEMKSQALPFNRRLLFAVHYCRIPHEYSGRLSAPETIPLSSSLPNADLLARIHDARYMVKRVRALDFDQPEPDDPGSVEFRASVFQLMKWSLSCGILCPRLELLTTEMLVFCVDQGWLTLGIRGAKDYMSRETIGKLIERCMYPKVLGMNVTSGQFAIRTPSGRKLGFSAIGKDMSPVATDTIKRAITRDMTVVANIATRTAEGMQRFAGEHEMYLEVIVRYWNPKLSESMKIDFYTVLLFLADQVMNGPMLDAVKTRIWPFYNETLEVSRHEGWVSYIGLSEMIVDKHIDFPKYCRDHTSAEFLATLHEKCRSHAKFDHQNASLEIRMQSQAETFGSDGVPNTGLDTNEDVDWEAILGPEEMAKIRAKPEDFIDDEGTVTATAEAEAGQPLPEISGLTVSDKLSTLPPQSASEATASKAESSGSKTNHTRIDSIGNGPSDSAPESSAAGPSHRFRTAAQAMHRLKWDEKHKSIHYEVGYKDRFDGLMWKPLEEWQAHTEEEDFIPEHRVEYLKQKDAPRRVVWSKKQRYDGT
ncbi:hypothetical protein Slin15195_G071990 [Septoria linicola]|uniref:MJ1316 RNA cyclic group end recognition domain-containing protein n=1 Tax=Septoria linicola TaxID=215465 RepID=A0A9Q9EKB1_9PEZI|nr:hypothetical protein Slin15195_G071990 [Septoria linicola]